MRSNLRCRVSAGQFSSEYAVIVRSNEGRDFSLFAQAGEVTFTEQPTGDREVDGWIAVDVVEQDRNLVLIRLPQTTLENGQFLTVQAGQLDRVPPRNRAVAHDPVKQ